MKNKKILNLISGLIILWFVTPVTWAGLTTAREQAIKAVFLFNFANFVMWPEKAFINNKEAFQLCILGDAELSDALELTVENQKSKAGRPLVSRLIRVDERYLSAIETCHILYVKIEGDLIPLFQVIQKKSILTVSDMSGFIEKGGMVKFFPEGNKIRLQVNPDMIKAAGMQVNANLLKLSKIKKISKPVSHTHSNPLK